jgi:hypothetical protein
MGKLLHKCVTKAMTAEGDDIRHSPNWVYWRRSLLQVYEERLECGDWVIPYSEIEEAVLFRTRELFIPGYVLRLKAQGQVYEFGLNTGRFWAGELPFPVRRERLGYSRLNIAVLVLAALAVAYWLWSRWG